MMDPMKKITRFHLVYVSRRDDPYYITNWDSEKLAEILSDTLENAMDELRKILGDPGRYKKWAIAVEKVSQEFISIEDASDGSR